MPICSGITFIVHFTFIFTFLCSCLLKRFCFFVLAQCVTRWIMFNLRNYPPFKNNNRRLLIWIRSLYSNRYNFMFVDITHGRGQLYIFITTTNLDPTEVKVDWTQETLYNYQNIYWLLQLVGRGRKLDKDKQHIMVRKRKQTLTLNFFLVLIWKSTWTHFV